MTIRCVNTCIRSKSACFRHRNGERTDAKSGVFWILIFLCPHTIDDRRISSGRQACDGCLHIVITCACCMMLRRILFGHKKNAWEQVTEAIYAEPQSLVIFTSQSFTVSPAIPLPYTSYCADAILVDRTILRNNNVDFISILQ